MKVPSRPLRAAGLVLVAGLAAWSIQATTTAHLKIGLKAAGFRRSAGGGATWQDALYSLGTADWILLGLLAVCGVALVFDELRHRSLTALVRLAVSRRRWAAILLALVLVVAVRPYLDAGIPDGYDARMHFAKTGEIVESLARGEYPSFSFRWYAGYPILRFYGPFVYLLAGTASLLFGSVTGGIRVAFLLCHAVSVVLLYRWLRNLSRSRKAALLGATIYALAFLRFYAVLSLGRFPIAPLHVGFVLALLSIEAWVRGGGALRYASLAALGAAVVVLSHPGLARHGLVALSLYGGVRFLGTPAGRRPSWRVSAVFLGVLTTGTVATTGYWVFDALRHRSDAMFRYLDAAGPGGLVPTTFSGRKVLHLLAWGFGPDRPSGVAYVGISVLALAIVAVVRNRRWRSTPVPALLAPILFLLPFAAGGYLEARTVQFLVPLLAALAGFALVRVSRTSPAVAVAFLVVVVDFLPLTALSPFRPDLVPVREALAGFAARHPGERCVLLSERGGSVQVSQWNCGYDSGVPLLSGPHQWGAGLDYPNLMACLEVAQHEFDGNALSSVGARVLRRFGVSYVLVEDGVRIRPLPLVGEGSPLAAVYDGPETADALEAARPVFEPGSPASRGHARLLIRAVADEAGGRPAVSVRSERDRVVVVAESREGGRASLRYSWFPDLRIRVDGRRVAVRRDRFGLIWVPVPAGRSTIELRGPEVPRTGLIVAIAAALVLALFAVAGPRRGRRPTPPGAGRPEGAKDDEATNP